MPYQFEWDADKAAANLRKHGVSFDEAVTAFADPLSVLLPDPDYSAGEERYLVMGMSTGSAARCGVCRAAATDAHHQRQTRHAT